MSFQIQPMSVDNNSNISTIFQKNRLSSKILYKIKCIFSLIFPDPADSEMGEVHFLNLFLEQHHFILTPPKSFHG